jgi:hypothetical protein
MSCGMLGVLKQWIFLSRVDAGGRLEISKSLVISERA